MSRSPSYSESILDVQSPVSTPDIALSRKNSQTARSSRRASTVNRRGSNNSGRDYPIIVHSHLYWDWVWQRPQQFISRLSRRHRVLFVELVAPDPELAAPLARFRTAESFPNITLLRLQFPSWRWSDGERVDRERRRLVQEFLAGPLADEFENPVQWFYDPMAAPAFLGQMCESLTVYDCMDELSNFACAPPEIVERELRLLERADLVFAGGRKLFESKSRFNENCYFYGCGVDGEHFGKACLENTRVPPEVAKLPQPVLGYFGVVDERMDYELLAALADANPEWSVVIVGPVLKVDEAVLPRRSNLHWLGKRSYEDLPALCKGFSVCLMPFALNQATEFINPTKTLEYLATGRPVVSTAVPDVVSNFGSVVSIGHSREQFIGLCRQSAEQPDRSVIVRGLQLAAQNSWDKIVTGLEGRVGEALARKRIMAGAA